jgi:hypothetical protein
MATFLSKLFKPKWQSKHTATRLEAIKELDANQAEDHKVLFSLAEGDTQAAVRKSATAKLTDTHQLIALHKKADDTIKPIIEKQLYELANKQSLSIFDLILDTTLLTEMIIKSSDGDAFLSGLARIEDPEALLQIAMSSKTTKIRQAAAELIETETQLSKLASNAKGKDKSVYQITKSKLSKLRNQAQEVDSQNKAIDKVLCDIQALAKTEALQHFDAKLKNIKVRWATLITKTSDTQQRAFDQQATICDQRIAALNEEKNKNEEQARLIQEGGDEQEATLFTLTQTLDRFRKEVPTFLEISAIDALIKTQENRWLEATRQFKVEKNKVKHYQLLMTEIRHYDKALKTLSEHNSELEDRIKELSSASRNDSQLLEKGNQSLKRLIQQIDWPKGYLLPSQIVNAKEALGHTAEIKQQAAESTKEIQQKISQQISKLDDALEEKQLKQSGKVLKDIQRLLSKLGAKNSDNYHNQLNLRINQLNELRDWQGYASNPRQQALCEAMERLSNTHLEPREKAEKIKTMQKEWKSLGGAADQLLWQRFKAAADLAYEPCQAFFEEQNQLKQNNISKRQQLITEISHFIEKNDWENTDWKAAEKINRQARLEWKEAYPVDFKANKVLQQTFNQLITQLDDKLDQERNKNLQLKNSIIEKAQTLIDLDDLEQAIQQAKTLQKEWQSIGITPYKQERELWKNFRVACDSIFARRDQVRNDKKEEAKGVLQEAATFCDELESYTSALTDRSFEELKIALVDFRKAYKQLPALPSKSVEQHQQRFESAIKLLKNSISNLENQQNLLEWQEVQRKASLCRRVFKNGVSDLDSLETEFNSQMELPKQLEDTLKILWISVKAGSLKTDAVVSEDQARSLCIACEIAAGIDSPETDKELRMQFQVSRLSEGMSSSSQHQSREQQLNASLLNWYSKVGLDTATFAQLETRIEKTIQHLLAN